MDDAALQALPVHDYLLNTLGIANAQLRLNILRGGFSHPDRFQTKELEFTKTVANRIVKRSGGAQAQKDITASMEADLKAFFLWCRYRFMTQRPVDLAEATRASIEEVSMWFHQQLKEPDALQCPSSRIKATPGFGLSRLTTTSRP